MAGYPGLPENLKTWTGLKEMDRKWPGKEYDWARAMFEWAEWVKEHLDTNLKSDAVATSGQPDPEVPPPPPPPFPD
jgi:hypothetical protein